MTHKHLARRHQAIASALALALAALGLALAPAAAPAFSNGYCGVLINEGSWCGDGSNHSYDYNRASYGGGGNVYVCERLLWADSSSQRRSPSCGYNYHARDYGSSSSLFEAEVTHIYSGGARHTISGYAVA